MRTELRSRYIAVAIAAALGMLGSIGAFFLVLGWEYRVATLAFETDAKSFSARLNNEFSDVSTLLSIISSYLGSSHHRVTADEFAQVSLTLRDRIAGVFDVVWCPRVTKGERLGFERAARAAKIRTDYHIVQIDAATLRKTNAPVRPQYYPILYADREKRSLLAGIDELGEPIRAAAVRRAIQTSEPSATPPISVLTIGDRGAMLGFIAVKEPADRGSARMRAPKGLVVCVFLFRPMLEYFVDRAALTRGLDFALYDPSAVPAGRLVYARRFGAGQPAPTTSLLSGPHVKAAVAMLDQQLDGIITPTTPLRLFRWSWRAVATLAGGLLFTFVVVTYLLSWIRQTARLNRLGQRITLMARHDELTGLPNRVLFRERLDDAIVRLAENTPFALLSLDLDQFKTVNDSLGVVARDQLLCAVAERMRSCLRAADMAARLGGDEFAIILADASDRDEMSAVADRLIREISTPYVIDARIVRLGASVGIALPTATLTSATDLMQEADLALSEAKRSGRGSHCFFERHLRTRTENKNLLENDLRHAFENDEFVVYYQPIIDLVENRVAGFEALVRWIHPQRGLVPPDEFVPLAEELGLIIPLGVWVLGRACADAASWPQPLGVAVNISPRHLLSNGLLADVHHCLATSGLAASRLEIEITEAAVLEECSATLATLDALRALGVRIAFDDFGTGFSSLSSVLRFPFDKIKIDKSFVMDCEISPRAAEIVRAIAGLGINLGLTITGEGVEGPEQLAHLRRSGCTQAQGYLFSRARPNVDVPRLIADLNAGLRPAAALAPVLASPPERI